MTATFLRTAALAALLASASVQAVASPAVSIQGTSWDVIARRHQIDPLLMYAVALQESRRVAGRGLIAPHPFAMNSSESGAHFPATREAAATRLTEELKTAANVDVCPMQISLRWNGSLVSDPTDLFDVPTCLEAGAKLLSTAMKSAPGDLELGIGRYHTWNRDRENDARRYGREVLRIWINLLKAS